MTEWARTEELSLRYTSWLFEAQWTSGPHRPYYRLERTDRPEEERLLDPFRSIRPHLDNSILGVSRWVVHTAGYGFTIAAPVVLEPLVEVGHAAVVETKGGIFNVANFFGRTSLWSLTVALRVRSPGPAHRMGRYGVAGGMVHHHLRVYSLFHDLVSLDCRKIIVPPKSARVVILHSAEVQRASLGDKVRARVKLERPSRGVYVGTAETGPGRSDDLRCSAQAALDALSQAVGPGTPVTFELRDVETFDAFGQQAVMVSLTITVEHQSRSLMGFCPVGDDAPKAAARAVLDATNRLLGVG